MTGTYKHQPIQIQFTTSSYSLGQFFRSPNLITTSTQQMKASLVDIVSHEMFGDGNIFLIEDTLVSTYKTKNLSVWTHQPIDYVMATWGLSSVETDTDANLAWLGVGGLAESDDLMATFG